MRWLKHDFLVGAATGMSVGLVEGVTALSPAQTLPAPLVAGEVLLLLLWTGALGASLAMGPSLLLGPLLRSPQFRTPVGQVLSPYTRSGRWLAVGALFAATFTAIGVVVSKRPMVDAIEFRPLLVMGALVFGGVGFTRLLQNHQARVRASVLLPALALAVGVFGATTTVLPRVYPRSTYHAFRMHTFYLSDLFERLRSAADSDGDGFPAAPFFCVPEDCDPDDRDPLIYPGSVQWPLPLGEDALLAHGGGGKLLVSTRADADGGAKADPSTGGKVAVPKGPPSQPTPGDRPWILLITIDALRADHVGYHGYHRDTTPNLDRLAGQSVVFMQARVQGPMTRFSLPSMLTGRYFTEVKRSGRKWPKLHPDNMTFAEVLRDGGYHTVAIHAHGYFSRVFGMHQGFNTWDVSTVHERDPVHWNATGDLQTDKALEYLREKVPNLEPGQPVLMWIHYMDPHAGWIRHPDLPSFGPRLEDRYDQEILFTDLHINRLFEGLEEMGLWERFTTFVTADHGEGVDPQKDRGFRYHGQHMYDNLLHVPFMVYGSGLRSRRINTPIGLIDLFPTFLDLAGIEPVPGLRGATLVPFLRGHTPDHPPVFSEKPRRDHPAEKAMIKWPYKVIWNLPLNSFSVFNLEDDPGESRCLVRAGGKEEKVEPLLEKIRYWRNNELEKLDPL